MGAERLTEIGAVLADRTRATLLVALMDGRAHTAGELARHAGVAPSTVSGHLGRLLDADFVAQEAQGRHRYFRLAGREVAAMLEALGAADSPERRSAAPGPQAPSDLIYARSCYDHLAGTLAVRLHDRLLADDHLRSDDDGRLVLTVSGEALLAGLGIDTGAAPTRGPSNGAKLPGLDGTPAPPRWRGRHRTVRRIPRTPLACPRRSPPLHSRYRRRAARTSRAFRALTLRTRPVPVSDPSPNACRSDTSGTERGGALALRSAVRDAAEPPRSLPA